jgi:hypothetical protein
MEPAHPSRVTDVHESRAVGELYAAACPRLIDFLTVPTAPDTRLPADRSTTSFWVILDGADAAK